MEVRSLSRFLEGRMRAEDLAGEIQDEVRRYQEGLNRTGTSVPVLLVGDHGQLEVRASSLLLICEAFLSHGFSRWDVHYVCDALTLSEATFTSERVRELLEELANPEIRAEQLSKREVLSVHDELVALGGE